MHCPMIFPKLLTTDQYILDKTIAIWNKLTVTSKGTKLIDKEQEAPTQLYILCSTKMKNIDIIRFK